MVEEHSKGLSEGQSLAKAKRVEAPAAPNKKHRAAMKKLESQSGAGFDKAYMNQMVQDHQEALKLVRNASKNAKDAEIRAAAEKKCRWWKSIFKWRARRPPRSKATPPSDEKRISYAADAETRAIGAGRRARRVPHATWRTGSRGH